MINMKPEHITLYIVLFLMMIGSTCIEHYRFKKHNKGKLTKFSGYPLGFFVMGVFFIILSNLVDSIIIVYTGYILTILSGITFTIYMWKENKIIGISVLILILITLYFL